MSEAEAIEKRGNNRKMKVYLCVSKTLAFHIGDIVTDLGEQRQYEKKHIYAVLQSNLILRN